MTEVSEVTGAIEYHRIPEIVVPGKRLGRNIKHDPRSFAPEYLVPRTATPLRSVKHERHVPVFDQGSIGSCTGNAAVGALACSPLFDALPAGHPALDEALAVEVYSKATAIDDFEGTYPPEDTGSNGLSVAKVLQQLGLISGFRNARTIDEMRAAMMTGPVIIGINWYSSFDDTDEYGELHLGGELRGGHEVAVVELDMEHHRFGAWNSWGPSWGLDGYFYLPFPVMAELMSERADCTQLLPVGGA